MKKWLISSLFIAASIFAETSAEDIPSPHKSPQEIQAELDRAEKDFQHALTLFNPWYTGPIIAAGATMMPPGVMNVQPYLFAVDNYASFDKDGNSVHASHPLWQLQLEPEIITGITSWLDVAVAATLTSNFRNGQSFTGLEDIPVIVGFKILKQGVWVPAIKVSVNETFPVGKYQHLSVKKQGTDSTGGGSWVTNFTFRIAKLLFWWTHHPLNTRLFLSYNVPTTVRVRSLNSYGGGYGTRGKVRPGNKFVADLGIEWSLTQQWALATDVVYTATRRTKFTGDPGVDTGTGLPATVGKGSSYSFQLAPAVEYSWNDSLCAIAGIWFTPFGRNSGNFINYTFSLSYTFPVD